MKQPKSSAVCATPVLGFQLCQASDVAIMRGTRFVGLEDILFLLRKDKVRRPTSTLF